MEIPVEWGNGQLQLLALDPGGTTGWASYRAQMLVIDNKAEYFQEKFDAGQMGPSEHHRALFDFLCKNQTQMFVLVCESFQYRPNQQHAELIANEYIGVVKHFEQERKPLPVVWQTKSYGRGFFTDDKLKVLRKYYAGHKHANDAMGHLLQYMVFGPLDRKDILGGLRL